VPIAIGIKWEAQRQALGVELANRESQSSWRDFLRALKQRGLSGFERAVSHDHAGLREVIGQNPSGDRVAALVRAFPACQATG
jgi:transposase-like protein